MKENKKKTYLAPTVKEVSYKVEMGLGVSSGQLLPITGTSNQVQGADFAPEENVSSQWF